MKETIEVQYKEEALYQKNEIAEVAERLAPYLDTLRRIPEEHNEYSAPESFISLPFDEPLHRLSMEMAAAVRTEHLKYIIVIGIGGSNLGTQAIYEACMLKTDIVRARKPKLIFIETVNPRELEMLKHFLTEEVNSVNEIVLNIVTKSGTTTETIANAEFLLDVLSRKFGEAETYSRVVVTTDQRSSLWDVAIKKGMKLLPVPPMVRGRYSVFSPVGVFPLFLAGVDTKILFSGAQDIVEKCLLADVDQNPALFGAAVAFLAHKDKLSIYNSFYFHSELESLGKWWRQLTAESLGKQKDGVGMGMTPVVSIGSTDLHSMVQLYFGGPEDKFTNFVYAEGRQSGKVFIPKHSPFEEMAPDISGKDFASIMNAIYEGTKSAYKTKHLPYIETRLLDISENSIGQYMQMKMFETIFLAQLWEINAFDQPDVDRYKKVTKELLAHQK